MSNVVLICGSRNWKNRKIIDNHLRDLIQNFPPSETIIIHGNCRGADKIASDIATKLDYTVIGYPADWNNNGKSAGPRRNAKMLDENNVNFTLAFHDDLSESKGTIDMIRKCLVAKIKVKLVTINNVYHIDTVNDLLMILTNNE